MSLTGRLTSSLKFTEFLCSRLKNVWFWHHQNSRNSPTAGTPTSAGSSQSLLTRRPFSKRSSMQPVNHLEVVSCAY